MSAFTRLFTVGTLAIAAGICLDPLPAAHAQSPPLFAEEPSPSERPNETDSPQGSQLGQASGEEETATLTAEELAQVDAWIEQLGANEFAIRERAAGHLMEKGKAVLPALRLAIEESADAETRLRAEQIAIQMTQGDLQARIKRFLAGRDVKFSGWYVTQGYLGDSISVRELFVEMMVLHPDFVESLDGTARDRALALEKLVTRVQDKFRIVGQDPARADVFALLLLGNDPNVVLNNVFESALLNLMRRRVATSIRRDAHLSGPFHALLNKWMVRSSLASREDVLLLGMSWDLPSTLPLALHSLDEATQTETIATCMQAIAKFGRPAQTELLRRFLDDDRPVSDRGFVDTQSTPQLRDLAMLTIAMIHGLPLDEIGMSHVQTHPASGFILSDMAYPSDPEGSRKKARKRIDRLIQDQGANEES